MMLMHASLILLFWTLRAHLAVADCNVDLPKPFLITLENCSLPSGVDSWGVRLNVASQAICVVPTLVVNNTVVMDTAVCVDQTNTTSAQCNSDRGGTFNSSQLGPSINTPLSLLAPDPLWTTYNPAGFSRAANVTLDFSPYPSLSNFTIALTSDAPNSNANYLGLANDSVVLNSLVAARLAVNTDFGFYAGSQSLGHEQTGHIAIGGYAPSLVENTFTNYSMSDKPSGAGARVCALQVVVKRLVLHQPGLADVVLTDEGTPMPSCIEPYDNLFRLPGPVLGRFTDNSGWKNDSSLASDKLYIVEPGLNYGLNKTFNGTLTFTLDGGLTVEIPSYELAGPLRGIDPDGKRVIQRNVTTVNIFGDPAFGGTATLGKIFLSQLYLTVLYSTRQFQLAPIAADNDRSSDIQPFISTSSSMACTASSKSVSGLRTGEIVLGVILALVIFILAALAFQLYSRRKAADAARQEGTNMVAGLQLQLVKLEEDMKILESKLGTPSELPENQRGYPRHRPSEVSADEIRSVGGGGLGASRTRTRSRDDAVSPINDMTSRQLTWRPHE